MSFQRNKGQINWKVHFASPIEKVFTALTTDSSPERSWENGFVEAG